MMMTEEQKLFFCELNHIKNQLWDIAEQWRGYNNISLAEMLEQRADALDELGNHITSGGERRDIADYKIFLDDARIFMYRSIIDFENFERKTQG